MFLPFLYVFHKLIRQFSGFYIIVAWPPSSLIVYIMNVMKEWPMHLLGHTAFEIYWENEVIFGSDGFNKFKNKYLHLGSYLPNS